MADAESNTEKHAGGRPLTFTSVDDLDMAIQKYFDSCDPHVETHMTATGHTAKGETMFEDRKILTDQKPYTMAGLARALGVNRRTLLNYKKRDEFFPSIQGAIDRCEEYAESQLFGPFANGAKFSLINNYKGEHQDWADKHNVDHTTKDMPIPLLAGLAPDTLEVEDEDDGGATPADDSSHEDK
jgi:hypothetical protein